MIQLQSFIAVLNLNLKMNAFFFKFKRTKFILKIVKLLIKHSYFIGYKNCCADPEKIIIFFKLNFERSRPLMLRCKVISTPSRPIYIRYQNWFRNNSSLLIISTSRGLLTNRDVSKYRQLGGVVLCKIY